MNDFLTACKCICANGRSTDQKSRSMLCFLMVFIFVLQWDLGINDLNDWKSALDIGPGKKIKKGLLLNSTEPKIMLEGNTKMHEIYKVVLRERFCVKGNIKHDKCWDQSLPENKWLEIEENTLWALTTGGELHQLFCKHLQPGLIIPPTPGPLEWVLSVHWHWYLVPNVCSYTWAPFRLE